MLSVRSLNRRYYTSALALIVAFCSIVYELLLAQTYATILGNSVLRYSTTIGIFLFSLGMGSYFSQRTPSTNPEGRLFWTEVALATAGLLAPSLVIFSIYGIQNIFSVESFEWSALLIGHAWISVIGILSGFEIPLLIQMNASDKHRVGLVLLWDYIGSCVGCILFAFVLYKSLGLIRCAGLVAGLNLLAAAALLPLVGGKPLWRHLVFVIIAVTVAGHWVFEAEIRHQLTRVITGG